MGPFPKPVYMKAIELFTYTQTTSASGFVESTPVSYWITRAEVEPLKSSRGQEAYQTILQSGYVFKMRYRADKAVSKDMTLRYNGQDLTIHSIENVQEEGRFLKVTGLIND